MRTIILEFVTHQYRVCSVLEGMASPFCGWNWGQEPPIWGFPSKQSARLKWGVASGQRFAVHNYSEMGTAKIKSKWSVHGDMILAGS